MRRPFINIKRKSLENFAKNNLTKKNPIIRKLDQFLGKVLTSVNNNLHSNIFVKIICILVPPEVPSRIRIQKRTINRIRRLENSDDLKYAYSVFQFTETNITKTKLRKKYRQFSLLIHPDKCDVQYANDVFQIVEACHRRLQNIV